jgi:hypothetical protein
MIIVYGTRYFGHADAVPGVGHVACRFVHIMFIPLFPIETALLMEEDEDSGVKVPFSFKAALSGWLRGGSIVAGLASLAACAMAFSNANILGGVVFIVTALASFAGFPLVGWLFGRCSDQRKAELMAHCGMVPEGAAPQHAMPMDFNQQPQHAPQPMPMGAQPPAGGYGAPQQLPHYGAPMQQPQYGAPPQQAYARQQPYGAPPQPMPHYGAPMQQPQYGAPPQQQPYGAPPQQQAWNQQQPQQPGYPQQPGQYPRR